MSDLHFGSEESIRNLASLQAQLNNEIHQDGVDRFIITGDLWHSPIETATHQFNAFRQQLSFDTKDETIVIPGNHDKKRYRGAVSENLEYVANLEWSSLIIDDRLQCIFYCFDTSKKSDLAKGQVTEEDMRDIETRFNSESAKRKELREYLPIALIHHHPYGFDKGVEIVIPRISLSDRLEEIFLHMEHTERFLTWCANRAIPIVLHGHKHLQRYVSKDILYKEYGISEMRSVTAIGCGTSLSVEDKPLAYNVIKWDSIANTWSVLFWADLLNGKGFTVQRVIHLPQAKSMFLLFSLVFPYSFAV